MPATVTGAVSRYLDHLTVERGLAVHTLSAYRRDLLRYQAMLAARGRTVISEVTTDDVAAYLAGLREGDGDHSPLAASSAGRAVVAVRGLHAFAAAEGLARSDPASLVHPPVSPRKLPRAIGVQEVERLIAAAGAGDDGDAARPLRDRALLELLYGTGARISEAVGLDVDDLGFMAADDTDGRAGPALASTALASTPSRAPGRRRRRPPSGWPARGAGTGSSRSAGTPARPWRRTWSGPGRRWRLRPAGRRSARRCS